MSAVARLRAYELSSGAFLRFALTSLAGVWLIVTTGAAVRLTDSGLGCRNWPGCEKGHPLPAKDVHAFVEFGNRLVGGATILLTLAAALAAWRTPALPRFARWLAVGVFAGALAQAPLGYLAVATDLRWPVVMAHLLLSILLLGGAVVLALEAFRVRDGESSPLVPRELRKLGLVLVAACFALVVSGTFATAAGPHSGGGKHIQRLGRLEPLVYSHAVVVVVFASTFLLALGYLAANRARAPRLFRAAIALLVLLVLQMTVGEIQYQTHLPWGLVLVHVGLAATVWAGTVALVTLFWRPPAFVSLRT
jgi:cytochrome c oxidase assembly protein subunit 15